MARAARPVPDWRDRPIVLVGFMGSGKSSVGRFLAARLDRPFLDSDDVIEAEGGKSITELFELGGEVEFRRIEAETVARLVAQRPPGVLALGGGALETPPTADLVCREGFVVHLALSFADLESELDSLASGRPLLATRSADDVRALFVRRQAGYARAHLVMAPDRSGPKHVADALVVRLAASPAEVASSTPDRCE